MMNNLFNIDKLMVIILCISGSIFGIFSAFPGHTNFDEFNSLNEIFSQNLSNIQPHCIVFYGFTQLDLVIF